MQCGNNMEHLLIEILGREICCTEYRNKISPRQQQTVYIQVIRKAHMRNSTDFLRIVRSWPLVTTNIWHEQTDKAKLRKSRNWLSVNHSNARLTIKRDTGHDLSVKSYVFKLHQRVTSLVKNKQRLVLYLYCLELWNHTLHILVTLTINVFQQT